MPCGPAPVSMPSRRVHARSPMHLARCTRSASAIPTHGKRQGCTSPFQAFASHGLALPRFARRIQSMRWRPLALVPYQPCVVRPPLNACAMRTEN